VEEYEKFLETKQLKIINSGFVVEYSDISNCLFDYQKDLVKWAIKKGKAALFVDTGLGKTLCQLEFARLIYNKEKKPILILAPLAVSHQTIQEAKKYLGIEVKYIKDNADVCDSYNITNYERLERLETDIFDCIVLDESGILKSFNGKTRDNIINKFAKTPYKLACSATPAPNDYMELGNHSEFLNELSYKQMLSMYFVHDGGETATWRLKGHAKNKFWEWLATWAAVVRKPSDLGYYSDKFNLPELKIHHILADTEIVTTDTLFATQAKTLQEKRTAKKGSMNDRIKLAAEIANDIKEPVLIWCEYNEESKKLSKLCDESIEITGSDKADYKEKYMLEFSKGNVKTLISKAKICGFGMNFQVCSNMIFVGMTDSFESYYQAVRRCWRFGQKNTVNVYIITSEQERSIVTNIERKERDYKIMMSEVVKITADIIKQNLKGDLKMSSSYNPQLEMKLPNWL
jgi:superfamily II DNA or RNA helicase